MAAAVSTFSQKACTETRGAGAICSSRPEAPGRPESSLVAWLPCFILFRHSVSHDRSCYLPTSLILAALVLLGSAVSVLSPLVYFCNTVARRMVEVGVSPRGWTRSEGSATSAARARCVAQP